MNVLTVVESWFKLRDYCEDNASPYSRAVDPKFESEHDKLARMIGNMTVADQGHFSEIINARLRDEAIDDPAAKFLREERGSLPDHHLDY